MPGRVRVFLSSTIRDFADLRSALRFWLEQLGFEVLTSEVTDFDRRPDSATFDACIEAIGTCNYVIVLIGARAGSPFTEDVTVTRREFQIALTNAEAGRLAILPYVRSEIRFALREMNDRAAAALLDPSGAAADPEAAAENVRLIRAFINEVDTTRMTVLPGQEGGNLWTYTFSGFSDIGNSLRVTIGAIRSVRKQELLTNLRSELEDNLAKLLTKHKEVPFPVHWFLGAARRELRLDQVGLDDQFTVDRRIAQRLFDLQLFGSGAANLKTDALINAILSGEFLELDIADGRLIVTAQLEGMRALREQIEHARQIAESFRIAPFLDEFGKLLGFLRGEGDHVAVLGFLPLLLCGFHDRLENILRLSIALELWFDNPSLPFQMPALNPSTPDPERVAEFEAESVTRTDLQIWLRYPTLRDRITGLQTASLEDWQTATAAYPVLNAPFERIAAEIAPQLHALLGELEERRRRDGDDAAFDWLQNQYSALVDYNLEK